jgi:hypothetical protein
MSKTQFQIEMEKCTTEAQREALRAESEAEIEAEMEAEMNEAAENGTDGPFINMETGEGF